MASLLSKVSSAVAACAGRATRLLLRARRLRRGGSGLGRQLIVLAGGGDLREDDGQAALWRRAILMGQRCEPLDFPGAIYYDSLGRRIPAPRSGSAKKAAAAAVLLCRSSDVVDKVVAASKRARHA